MFYINEETLEYPIEEGFIRTEHPASYPVPFVPPAPYAAVQDSLKPECNQVIQKIVEDKPVKVDGTWQRTWEVVDKFQDYTDEQGVFHSKAEQEAEAIAEDENRKKAVNKNEAMNLLQQTDWADNPSVTDTTKPLHLVNAAEWDAYRDALRLIAVVPPVEVAVWPVKPEEQWSV